MKYKVRISRRAKGDRLCAYEWYAANFSVEYALRWFTGIAETIESLSVEPHRHPQAVEHEAFAFELREVLYGTKKNKHRVLYTIQDDIVFVLHIRHSAQRDLAADDL